MSTISLSKQTLLALLSLFLFSAAIAQRPANEKLSQLAHQHALDIFPEYLDFLRIPNDALSSDMEVNMAWAEKAFKKRGFKTRRLPTGSHDWVFAEKTFSGVEGTVLFYMHIDGQAVDRTKWFQTNPYEPVLKEQTPEGEWEMIDWDRMKEEVDPEWRIFARSAADAKGPVLMFLAAMDVMLKEGWEPNFNLKIIMDSEEEVSAPHVPASVKKYKKNLQAERLVILDGPVHLSNKPTLVFGARGIATLRLTTYGPRTAQHSGHYGNYVPNPALHLAQLLASMKDTDGSVTIPGFYDGIELDEFSQTILAQVPDDEVAIKKKIGIGGTDKVGNSLQEALQYPSLNIRGMASAWVGAKVRTIIPEAAVAHLDIRLVKESDPEQLIKLIRQHVEAQGYHILEVEPTEEERMRYPRLVSMASTIAYPAFRTDMDSEIGHWLVSAQKNTFGAEPVQIRTMGGSVPISPFVNILEVPGVILPLVNPDNNQHSPNENLRLGNFLNGVQSLLGVLVEPF